MIRVDVSSTYQTIQGFGVMVPPHSEEHSSVYSHDFFDLLVNDLGCDIVRTMFLTQNGAVPDQGLLDIQLSDFADLVALKPDLKILASISSPPAAMKSADGRLNPGFMSAFGNYLFEMCDKFDRAGCPVYGMGLQNGPTCSPSLGYDRDGGPLSACTYDAESYQKMFKVLCTLKGQWGSSVKLIASEDDFFLLPRVENFVDCIVSDPATASYLDILGAQGYIDTSWGSLMVVRNSNPEAKLKDLYAASNIEFLDSVKQFGKEIWMLEDCSEAPHWVESIDYDLVATPRDPHYIEMLPTASIDLALKIRSALVDGGFSSYVYWLASTVPGDPVVQGIWGNDPEQALCHEGIPTCKYQAAKHFFKYVTPGMVRTYTSSTEVDSCAFISDDSIVVVLINDRDVIVDTVMDFSGISVSSFTSYTSVENDYHQKDSGSVVGGRIDLSLLPNSITTFVVE